MRVNTWLENNQPTSLSESTYKKWLKDLKLPQAKMETLDKNFTKATQWWQNRPNHASKQIQRVSVAMGLRLPTSWLFTWWPWLFRSILVTNCGSLGLPLNKDRRVQGSAFLPVEGYYLRWINGSFPKRNNAKQAGGTTQFVVTSNTSATHFEHCQDCTLVHIVAILTRRWQNHKAEPILENDGGTSHG